MAPATAPVLETERLRLIRISDTSLDSEHLKWFHETWSDPVATQWSLHGATTSLSDSQAWFKEHLSKYDCILYMVFEKNPSSPSSYPGTVIGNIGLRTQIAGPSLPPFDPAPPSSPSTPLNLRSIGYSYLPSSWGKGFATEAARAVLEAYREGTKEERAKGEERYYVEGIWDPTNEASGRVLGKVGFKRVGVKVEEKVWLAGGWRDRYVVSGWDV